MVLLTSPLIIHRSLSLRELSMKKANVKARRTFQTVMIVTILARLPNEFSYIKGRNNMDRRVQEPSYMVLATQDR